MAKTPTTTPAAELDPAANPALLSEDDADTEATLEGATESDVQARIAEAVANALQSAEQAAAQAREEVGVAPLVNVKRVSIILEENDDIPPTGLFIGVNGRSYMLRPGEEVKVPEEVIHCLNDAVMATPKTDQQGNVIDYRNRLRFPYRIVSDGY